MKFVVALLSLCLLPFAHAEKLGDSNGTAPVTVNGNTAPTQDQGEYGSDDAEVAGPNQKNRRGHSWRNTQLILKGMNLIRCRKGGMNARSVAIPNLASEGFCNQKNENKKAEDFPAGTVWVYQNGEDGNTAVKLKDGGYFTNRKMSAPPQDRGNLIAIMVPKCGKPEKTCRKNEYVMRDFRRELAILEKKSDKEKIASAEAGEREENKTASARKKVDPSKDNSQFIQDSMFPTPERLKAEERCEAHTAAFRNPTGFVECMEREQ